MSLTRITRTARRRSRRVALAASLGLILVACGGADAEPEVETEATAAEEEDRLHVVATTSILGDIVSELVGDDGQVTVIMPPGADPHAYEPSAQDAATLREADLVVANGLQLEESLVSALDAVVEEGGNVFELAEQLDPIEYDGDAHDGHAEEGHADEHAGEDDHADEHAGEDDHADEHADDDHDHEGDDHADADDHAEDEHDEHAGEDDHGHAHGAEDPHVWFDPVRMADGVTLLAAEIAAVDTALDAAEWTARGEAYAAELLEVHDEMVTMFAEIPEDDRVLITNHEALGYLAARYDFELLGTVIPGSSTQAEADPRGFAELVETVEEAGVSVVFAENTDSTVLADQLASEVVGRSDVQLEVVSIYTDALGEEGSGAETYLGLLRTDAELIRDALS